MKAEQFEEYENKIKEIEIDDLYFPTAAEVEKYIKPTPGAYADFILWLLHRADNLGYEMSPEQVKARKMLRGYAYKLFPLDD